MMQFCISFLEVLYNVFMKFTMEMIGENLADAKTEEELKNIG